MSKRPNGKPSASERADLIQFLINRGMLGSAAAELISSDRTRKQNTQKIIEYIQNIKRV